VAFPAEVLSELRRAALAGIRRRHPEAGPEWWRRRVELFEAQWPRYLSHLERWERDAAAAAGKGKKPPRPLDFYTWQTIRRERRKGGGLKGSALRAVATPAAGPLGIAAGGLLGLALPAVGPLGSSSAVRTSISTAVPGAVHAAQAATPEGRRALAVELVAYGAVAAPFAGPALGGALKLAGGLVAGADAGGSGVPPPAAPRGSGGARFPVELVVVAGAGLALFLLLR
jgi:hypothetical protein